MFLAKQDKEALSNAQSALLQCKQSPEESFLHHSGNFNKIVRLLRDLGDTHVQDEDYVFMIFKQSLNMTYSEVLRPIEVTNTELTYDGARQELLCLELAGKVFTTMSIPGANIATSTPYIQNQTQSSNMQATVRRLAGTANSIRSLFKE